jgi:uncharacterized membrane protein (DUF2068 family)
LLLFLVIVVTDVARRADPTLPPPPKAPPTTPPPAKAELAFRSIVAYKTGKATLQVGLAVMLLALLPFGLPDWLAILTVKLRHRFVQGLSIRLVNLFAWTTTPHRLDLTIGALFLDGGLTAVEALALKRDYWWAPWLVALVTATLVPFEIAEWIRHPHLTRVALLAANVAIVAYLARRAWLHRRARRTLGTART